VTITYEDKVLSMPLEYRDVLLANFEKGEFVVSSLPWSNDGDLIVLTKRLVREGILRLQPD
jgi:hypothetical protein